MIANEYEEIVKEFSQIRGKLARLQGIISGIDLRVADKMRIELREFDCAHDPTIEYWQTPNGERFSTLAKALRSMIGE
jgi:hypothetical protein